MAITVGNVTTSDSTLSTNATSRTFSHNNNGNSQNCLILTVSQQGYTLPTSVTYGGQAMTLVPPNWSYVQMSVAQYVLARAPTGNNNVVINFSARQDRSIKAVAITLNNVSNTSPVIDSGVDSQISSSPNVDIYPGASSPSHCMCVIGITYAFTSNGTNSVTLTAATDYPIVRASLVSVSNALLVYTKPEDVGRYKGVDANKAYLARATSIRNLNESTPTGVTLNAASAITSNDFVVSGAVSSAGTSSITQRGYVWATNTTNPTISSNKVVVAGTTGGIPNRTINTNTNGGTTHYVRAFATTAAGTTYSDSRTVTTLADETPSSTVISSFVSTNRITVNGNVSSAGTENMTERGIVWKVGATPSTSDNKIVIAGTTGPMEEQTLNGLTPGQIIHFRSFGVNSIGTGYSEELIVKLRPAFRSQTISIT